MLRRLTAITLTLIVGLWGCSEKERIDELLTYHKAVQKFSEFTEGIQRFIILFDDPSTQVTASDLDKALVLLDEFAAAVGKVEEELGGLEDATLRHTHGLFVRAFPEARELANDKKAIEEGNLKRQAQSIAIGLRRLRRVLEDRVYPSIELLLAREGREGEGYDLMWSEGR
ncbi:MAG: hypothetical protein CME15_01035 [Gemmatimonadetes bacterium]|jgi:hypothetical protein|nr:hypothetical protein [Gemmatimonadota bacterium]